MNSKNNEFRPLSGREFPRFSAIKTFFRLPQAELAQQFDVAILGIPFDGGASFRPGQRFAPQSIRAASSLGKGYHWTRAKNCFDKLKFADIGDCPVVPIDLNKTYELVEKFVTTVLKSKKRLISGGGDHSITLPILRAMKKYYKEPLNLIHFDAHLDTYPAAWGCEYHHGSFARHAIDEGLVNPKHTLQIGIRGPLVSKEDLDFVKKNKVRVDTMDDVRKGSLADYLETLPRFKGPTYISFDVDCLDPAFAPGTGTPVPGGLTTYETQRILRSLDIDQLVGADVVEVLPSSDHSEITSLAAVDVMFECLHLF